MDIFTKLSPSSVRKIILEEHGQIKRKLNHIESSYNSHDPITLINAFRELLYFFLKHIEHEELILRPVLKDIDAWGGVRVDKMNKEHAEQRLEILKIDKELNELPIVEVLPIIKKFVSALYADMESEEKECLNPELLKDDPITSNNYSG